MVDVVVEDAATAVKPAMRRRLLAARRAVSVDVHEHEAIALANHLAELGISGSTACAYAPVGTEPGSAAMLDALLDRGVRVLLPVVRTEPNGAPLALMWGEYLPGNLVAARFGLLEPTQPWLPAAALAEAELVVVPALAVDRRGARLGRGAGFYDRSLPLHAPHARLIAVVRDSEVVDELPSEPHDVPMTHALTPGHGAVALVAGEPRQLE
ncbi:MAG: 5-formyltetrahydrofolate cyclo-ligase [Mycobacterium sp.]